MKRSSRWGLALLTAICLAACGGADEPDEPLLPYLDPDVALEDRIQDLISRMTLAEKASQLTSDSPAIGRLGIPAYNWWNEALHGVGRAGRATVFPQAIGIAATWDTDLMFRVATAISDEARAKHHEFLRRGKSNIYQGLTFWTPNINLFRDPRWGRGMETYGEDPWLTGQMAAAFITGMQGDDPVYLKTVATAKHYAVHSGPEPDRHTFDAVVSDRDLYQSYLPHFEAAIREAGAFSVMCAYNSVFGQPACASDRLMIDILRGDWGFQGYVVSDCAAIRDIYQTHRYVATSIEAVALAIRAGTDLNCGVEYQNVVAAADAGLLAEADLDRALGRLLEARFRLGIFDPPERVPYAAIPYEVNDSPEHGALALETAEKSIVLLRNQSEALPLDRGLGTIAVIGPNADDPEVLLGNYNGIPTAPVTPLAGIREAAGPGTRVLYERGVDLAEGLPTFEVVGSEFLFTSAAPNSPNGLRAEYFAAGGFDGVAHRPLELSYPSSGRMIGAIEGGLDPLFTRVDPAVDFYWWDGAPREDLDDDDFGVRWIGYLEAPETGTYYLGAVGMNAWTLYLDGEPIASYNNMHRASARYAAVDLEAGRRHAIQLDFHEYAGDAGIELVWDRPSGPDREAALSAAREADAVIMVLGLSAGLEGEEMSVPVAGYAGGDRIDIGLPGVQERLLRDVVALGKPTVLVLLNGSAVAVSWARENVSAILEAWYPGQAGGTALGRVLFGDVNPAGRLPVTFYRSENDLPPFTDYDMEGRTYRFFRGDALWRFGDGMSYTTFAYGGLEAPQSIQTGEAVDIGVDVTNTGNRAGEEVVQVYVSHPPVSIGEPVRTLVGFQRIRLGPGETRRVEFTIEPSGTAGVNVAGEWVVEPGPIEIAVGGHQPSGGDDGVLQTRVELEGVALTLPR